MRSAPRHTTVAATALIPSLSLPVFASSLHASLLACLVAPLLVSLLASCGGQTGSASTAAAPPTVAVITVTPSVVALSTDLPGRLEATRVAQVRARTPGIVLQRTFVEGSDVKAGQVLFRIDPASFQAAYDSAQAAVAKADANLAQADIKLKRYRPLAAAQAVSAQDYDDAVATQKQATADLASAKAARTNAALTLAHATVTAPIAGRIGRALVTEGALVGQGEATPMALVQQLDPIYVTLTESSTQLLRLRRALASGKLKGASPDSANVTLVTEDGQPYAHPGKLLFSDVSVDESSGAVSLRALFPNPEHLLLPGMYVRAQLAQAIDQSAITVPQQAVIRAPDGASVLVVGADNKVLPVSVTADVALGQRWLISSGLKGGERIVVEGFQKTKPGGTVHPVPWLAPDAANNAPAGAASR